MDGGETAEIFKQFGAGIRWAAFARAGREIEQDDVLPELPASRKITECHLAIVHKQAKEWARVDPLLAAAAARGAYDRQAEADSARLKAAYSKEFAAKCQKLIDAAQKNMEGDYGKLVDRLTDAPPVDPLKRAELAKEEESGPFRRW